MEREPTRGEYNRLIKAERGGKRPKFLKKFWEYHDNNSHVFEAYLDKARELEREGRQCISVGDITERLRHDTPIKTQDEEGLKLRHDLRAYYARFLVLVRPSLGERIKLCQLGRKHPQRPDDPPSPVVKDEPMTHWLKAHWMAGDDDGANNGRKRKK